MRKVTYIITQSMVMLYMILIVFVNVSETIEVLTRETKKENSELLEQNRQEENKKENKNEKEEESEREMELDDLIDSHAAWNIRQMKASQQIGHCQYLPDSYSAPSLQPPSSPPEQV